ncbi:hypothetical protein AB0368_33555 [Actinoplanes sp. NPDC051475]|uniref:hypothetical protein n=1 Tax=Actinoplanes sp. NPDC051475 TaxID=3157225 RepID=UPI0034507ECF
MSDKQLPRQRAHDAVCLRCRRLDQVVSVPAAVRAGHSTGVVHGSVTGRFGYDVPVTGRVSQVSALARALAAPRRPRAATGPAIVFGGSALLAMWNLLLAVSDPADGTAWFGLMFFLAVAAGSGWVLRAWQRRLRVMGPLVDEAVGLWRRSWYCRRCGVVSIYGPGAPTTVAASGLASALISVAQQRRQRKEQPVRPPAAGVLQ